MYHIKSSERRDYNIEYKSLNGNEYKIYPLFNSDSESDLEFSVDKTRSSVSCIFEVTFLLNFSNSSTDDSNKRIYGLAFNSK